MTGVPAPSRGRVALWWERRGADVFGVSAIVGFVLAYLSPAVKDGGSFGSFDTVLSFTSLSAGAYPGVPHNVLNGDSVTQMVPFNTFDWTAIHHLQFPLWNDLSLLGLNQFLNFQSAVLSLPDLMSYLAPLRFAFLVVVAMKLLIAGTGAYVLCRVLGLRPLASALGGVTFMLSGAFSAWLAWPLSGVVAWLGWIAALAILAYRWKAKRSYVVLLALSVAFCVYGGFPEAYFFVAAALVTFFAVMVALATLSRRRLSPSGVIKCLSRITESRAKSSSDKKPLTLTFCKNALSSSIASSLSQATCALNAGRLFKSRIYSNRVWSASISPAVILVSLVRSASGTPILPMSCSIAANLN